MFTNTTELHSACDTFEGTESNDSCPAWYGWAGKWAPRNVLNRPLVCGPKLVACDPPSHAWTWGDVRDLADMFASARA